MNHDIFIIWDKNLRFVIPSSFLVESTRNIQKQPYFLLVYRWDGLKMQRQKLTETTSCSIKTVSNGATVHPRVPCSQLLAETASAVSSSRYLSKLDSASWSTRICYGWTNLANAQPVLMRQFKAAIQDRKYTKQTQPYTHDFGCTVLARQFPGLEMIFQGFTRTKTSWALTATSVVASCPNTRNAIVLIFVSLKRVFVIL